jgi:2',3'-cyclic-nucleotide 2'-phosphodiesterase
MRIAFLGDVVGRPGRRAIASFLPRFRAAEAVDFVIANGENASGGKGLDPDAAEELFDAGVDVITTGNHVWRIPALIPYMRDNQRVLRPANFAPDTPGRGVTVRHPRRGGPAVGVLNVIGRVFMEPVDCPFRAADAGVAALRRDTAVVVVDVHAEATSEKVGMGRFLDGRVSLVVGSHTHVQTADEQILPGGTAYLTDAGMCGPEDSVLGIKTEAVLRRFVTQMPTRFDVASGPVLVQGIVVDVDGGTGRADAVRRFRHRVDT